MKQSEILGDDGPGQDLEKPGRGGKREAGYLPPPTARDMHMSIAHHTDSGEHDLQHGEAHVIEARSSKGAPSELYNLGHAQRHVAKALEHVRALKDRLSKNPKFRSHFRSLNRIGR